jgi:hypothetical protein
MSRNYPSEGHVWLHNTMRERVEIQAVKWSDGITWVEVIGASGKVRSWQEWEWYAWAKNATRTYPPQREPDSAV